jgi:hypothetical protein
MTNKFVEAAREESRHKFTENGCEVYNTTNSALLDLFSTVGALRTRDEAEITTAFERAYSEDPLLATKILFYGRDIRGGCGERDTSRTALAYYANKHPEAIIKNIRLIPEYGRWDDLYSLVGTKCENAMWKVMGEQFRSDMLRMRENKSVSLLAKWIKSADASSAETRRLGKLTAEKLGWDVYTFKRLVRQLRKYIDIVECKMSANKWDEIQYANVPSRAMNLYRDAFQRHDEERFKSYIDDVTTGKEKINSATLYPYDIVREMLKARCDASISTDVLEAQWKALPNYLDDEANILVMADVSGSMTSSGGRPICSAIGLAMYFAERNKGAFHNLFMTFSAYPTIVNLHDSDSLNTKISFIEDADWGMNTDFYNAVKKVLDICVENDVPPEDVPKAIVCISDMEFDFACPDISDAPDKSSMYMPQGLHGWNKDIVETLSGEFDTKGYTLPKIVFWNVDARHDTFHTDKLNLNTLCVSGNSPSAFKTVISCIDMNPYDAMLATLNDERYSEITIGEN